MVRGSVAEQVLSGVKILLLEPEPNLPNYDSVQPIITSFRGECTITAETVILSRKDFKSSELTNNGSVPQNSLGGVYSDLDFTGVGC